MFFEYKAKTKQGKLIQGTIETKTYRQAEEILLSRGLFIIYLKEKKEKFWEKKFYLKRGVPLREIVFFSRQLSIMIKAGLPLAEALELSVKQTSNLKFKEVLKEIDEMVRSGIEFSTALARYPNFFDSFYINLIKAGETSGRLEEVLAYLADETEKNYIIMNKIKGAMLYPIFVLTVATIVIIIMFIFVIPQLSAVLSETGAKLPLTTRILLSISNGLKNFWYLIILAVTIIFFSIRYLIQTDTGKLVWDNLKIKLPVFGNLYKKIYLVRLTRSLSTLIVGGVSLSYALRITGDVIGNQVYKDLLNKTAKAIESGSTISSVFKTSKEIPIMFSSIISVGEKTGKLDEILDIMANFFAIDLENMLNRLTSLLEPMIIVLLGLVIGFIAFALITPIFNLARTF